MRRRRADARRWAEVGSGGAAESGPARSRRLRRRPGVRRRRRVRRFPLRDLRHRGPAGGRLARKVAAAVLRWEGEGFRTARLEALLEQEMVTDPERVLRRVRGGRRAAPAHAGRGGRARARRSPARRVPRSRPTWRGRRSALARAREGAAPAAGALAALAAGRPGRGPRPTGWRSRPRAPWPRSRAAGTTRSSSSARRGVGQDPPAARASATRSPSAAGRWRASARREFTGELIEAIDRDAVGRLAGALPPGDRVPARRRAPDRRQGPDPGRAVRALQPR